MNDVTMLDTSCSANEIGCGDGTAEVSDTPISVADSISCGPDPAVHLASVRKYADAGYDEVFVQQIGPDQDEFFKFWADEISPRL